MNEGLSETLKKRKTVTGGVLEAHLEIYSEFRVKGRIRSFFVFSHIGMMGYFSIC